MKVSEFYTAQSKFLKASDLGGRKHRVVIDEVLQVDFKDKNGKQKIGITFVGKEKGVVLNKTNAQIIAKQHGDDMGLWSGKSIVIYPTTTDFNGEQVECIRVEQHIPEADPNDDIPF